jgi:hypothetical protein
MIANSQIHPIPNLRTHFVQTIVMKKTCTLVLLVVALQGSLAPLMAQPSAFTNQPASRAVWAGATVTFAAGVSGAGPFAYQWLLNGKSLSNGIIVTVAGGGTTLNGPSDATNSSLSGPSGVAVDALGNIFIADTGNNRVRQVGLDGVIRTVAGNGTWGYSGDGSPAIKATMMGPTSVASDASGNLFIGDNLRVREVSTNGVITTVAGGGTNYAENNGVQATNVEFTFGVSGVTVDTLGNLVLASGLVFKVATNGVLTLLAGGGPQQMAYLGDGGPATNAFLFAAGIAFDSSGDLFIADSRDGRIRYVNADGIIASVPYYTDSHSIIGGPVMPSGVAVDVWGTSSWQITTLSKKSTPMRSFPRLRTERRSFQRFLATAVRPPMPRCGTRSDWPWTPPAICSSPTPATIASARLPTRKGLF